MPKSTIAIDAPKPLTIRTDDAVRLTGLSRSTIERAIKANKLKAHKAGRAVLIYYADLQAFASPPTPA